MVQDDQHLQHFILATKEEQRGEHDKEQTFKTTAQNASLKTFPFIIMRIIQQLIIMQQQRFSQLESWLAC